MVDKVINKGSKSTVVAEAPEISSGGAISQERLPGSLE